MIIVERTAPLLTVQDRGRVGYFADGVTQSGALDTNALEVGNALVGNAHARSSCGAAALEGCLGGARFSFDADCTIALTGAEVAATHNGVMLSTYETRAVHTGDTIEIERIVRGAVWYLCVRGGIDVPIVLGSRSTLVSAALGGLHGAPLKSGARLSIGNTPSPSQRVPASPAPIQLRTPLDDAPIALTPGPRTDALTREAMETLLSATFRVSRAISRVGYRLEGARVRAEYPADRASEPACRGAMQLPPEGDPIVLMADHPTIGGYPIVGVVPAHALSAFAQRAPGSSVRFVTQSERDAADACARQRNALRLWVND